MVYPSDTSRAADADVTGPAEAVLPAGPERSPLIPPAVLAVEPDPAPVHPLMRVLPAATEAASGLELESAPGAGSPGTQREQLARVQEAPLPRLTAGLMRVLLAEAPRPLGEVEAELVFVDGQCLLHTRGGAAGGEEFRFLSAASLRSAFTQVPVDSGWLPPQTLRCGLGAQGAFIAQFMPPGMHSLRLSLADLPDLPNASVPGRARRKPRRVAMRTVAVPLPGAVFVGYGQQYAMWAVKDPVPSAASQPWRMPLPNLYASDGCCWGINGTQVPPASARTLGEAWRLFMTSEFNLHARRRRSRRYPEDVRQQLLALDGASAYPLDDLLAAEHPTLDAALAYVLEHAPLAHQDLW